MSQTPSNIGRYEVMNPIGQGGMGSLFLAWDPKLERKIAIKLLRDDDDALRERFSREARAAARLRHPNIVTIFDVGDHEGQPFIAMEYIQGHTLAEMIHRNTVMPLARKLELIEALCDGLGFAHKAGIVHRDIKPANLMVDIEGALKILDFGIARASESAGMTQAGMLIGTLNYMSPEQVGGATVDSRSDIFAVGAVFYEMIAYRQAFPGGLMAGILNKILTAQFEPIASVVPGLDPEIVRIIGKALQKDPAQRYQDLQTMRKELLMLRMRLETQEPTALVDAGSEMQTVIVPTPVPARRTTDREDLLRRRAAQIEAHVTDAEQKFGAGDFPGAIASCEQALLIDENHQRANELLDRARTAHEARQLSECLTGAARELQRGAVTAAREFVDRAAQLNAAAPGLAELREQVESAARLQEEARQRADALRALLQRGEAALGQARLADAIQIAGEAVALDPSSADAKALQARAVQAQEAAERAALEARARDAVAAAEREFGAGRHDAAIAALAAFTPAHAIATRALERFRADATRIAEERRLAAERQARQQRIAAGLQAAQADSANGKFGDAVEKLRALERAEGQTPEIAAALRDADTKHREAERAAQLAREIASHLQAATELLNRQELQQALAQVAAAQALDARHEPARQLRARIEDAIRADAERKRLEEAKRRAEEQAARQREKASAAAMKQARKARTPEAAIAVLREALQNDPNNAELQLLLDGRQAEHARAVAEQNERQRAAAELAEKQRKAAADAEQERERQRQAQEKRRAEEAEQARRRAEETEQARRRAEQAEQERKAREAAAAAAAAKAAQPAAAKPSPSTPDDRTVVLQPGAVPPGLSAPMPAPPAPVAQAKTQAKAPVAEPSRPFDREKTQPPSPPAVKARMPAAEPVKAQPRPAAAAPAPAAGGNQRLILIGAAAAVVLLVLGYLIFGRSSPPQTQTQAQQTPPPAASQPVTQQPPSTQASGQATAPPPAPAPDVAQTPAQTPQTPAQTPPQTATQTSTAAATTPPASATESPEAAVERQLTDIRARARQAWQRGDRAAALVAAESGIALGRGPDNALVGLMNEIQGDARKRAVAARAGAQDVGTFATSQQAFHDAEQRFAEAVRLPPRRMPAAIRGFWQAEELFVQAANEGREAAKRDASAKAAAAAKEQEAREATAKAAPPPAPAAPPVSTPPVNADETAILAVLRRYADAFTKNDARSVSGVMPSLSERELRNSFGQLNGQRMEITNTRVALDAGGTRAQVTCQMVHETRPKAGAPFTFNGAVTFLLEKKNGTWFILQRK